MTSRRVESFLLRFVLTDDIAPADIWRGRVQHISTGLEQKFDQLQDMLAFISEQLLNDHLDQPGSEMPSIGDCSG